MTTWATDAVDYADGGLEPGLAHGTFTALEA